MSVRLKWESQSLRAQAQANQCPPAASTTAHATDKQFLLLLAASESSSFKTLGKKTQAISLPQKLHDAASAASKNGDLSGERLLLENSLHPCAQAIETTTHIGDAGGDPYLRSGAKFDHLRKLSGIDLTSTASAPFSTLIIARAGNSM